MKPITFIVNLSLSTGIFPDELKIAKVVPLFKKNNPLLTENYRPTSILKTLSKIIEKVLFKRIYCFLEKYEILYQFQFGFKEGYSIKLALADLLEKIHIALDNGDNVLGIYIDL